MGAPVMEHVLKTDSEVFRAVLSGDKTYEIRLNDRNFMIGHILHLVETEYTGEQMKKEGKPLKFTGRIFNCKVTHILRGPIYGLYDGWVIMSIKSV
jgi:hypothetical protein